MPPVTLRRNGKVPSCEPCRKSKLSCDHDTPICGRCRRRKITERCVYHPAPMTNGGRTAEKSSPLSNSSPWPSLGASTAEPAHSPDAPSQVSKESEGSQLCTEQYLGSTSYSAVFTEGQSQIHIQDLPDADDEAAHAVCQAKLGLTPAQIQEGIEVLALLSDVKKYESELSRWYQLSSMEPMLPFVSECIASVTQRMTAKPETKAWRLALSEKVFINTSKDFIIQSTSKIQDLPSMLTGENLRWEIIGLIITAAGLSAISMDEVILDPEESKQHVDWKDMAKRLLSAGDKCICFSEKVGSLNDVGIWLISMNFILHTQVEGDADPICWRKQGDLTTAVFAAGLHQESKESVHTPFWLLEIRRKCFWFAFNLDKVFATFFGRPPMINGSFCTRQIPLDLEDAQLALTGPDLEEAIGKLDAAGWNTEGEFGRSAWLRISGICAKFREEVLELSLGSSTYQLRERAHDILRRQSEAHIAMPAALRDRADRWVLERSMRANFLQLSVHVDPIYNDFLLQRTLVRRIREEPTELIRVSRSMLSQLLVLCGNRHRMGAYAADLPWLIALYGLPPAGVLALELLQQFSSRTPTPDPNFPRSDVIQKLSVLISSIDCIVRPTNGDYGICGQAKKMLQAILDTVLAPAPALPPTPAPVPDTIGPGLEQHNLLNGVGQHDQTADPTALEGAQMWFDDTNFDMDFWNNLEDHPLLAWPDAA